ncbi:hypothetical protein QQF64_024859 [Cirrhinus molitorella]|uniref:AIG1-type G domain-containing protein n=1 Tax=Cirrhinus molitorella TaxID=172907 RepID=A0ABR3NMG5_9TELE
MILFTKGDDLEDTTFEDYQRGAAADLKTLISKCGGRCHVFNNIVRNGLQVTKLLQKIQEILQQNGGGCYTNSTYQLLEQYKKREAELQRKAKAARRGMEAREAELQRLIRYVEQEQQRQSLREAQLHEQLMEQSHVMSTMLELMQIERNRNKEWMVELKTQKQEEEQLKHQLYMENKELKRKNEEFQHRQRMEMERQRQRVEQEKLEMKVKMDELRIVLLGKQGAGKSASGNTLLRNHSFHSEQVTQTCLMAMSTVDKQSVQVIDTPGWCDSSRFENDIKQEIIKCISMSSPGPHAFLLVLPIGRFTNKERNTVIHILKEFGEEVIKYMIVLFTKGDELEDKPIEDYLKEVHSDLKKIIQICGGRYHVFNNRGKNNQHQVSSLLKKINEMVRMNKEKCYTTAMYQKVKNQ